MLKKYILPFVILSFFYGQINAQITDYKTSVYTDNILIEDNYLYFTDLGSISGTVYVNIKRIDLIEGLPLETVVASFESSGVAWPAGLAKNGDYIYCSDNDYLSISGELFKLDITGASEPESLFSGGWIDGRESDMAYKSNYLYRTEYSSFDVVRENVSLTPPLASTVYLNFDGIARARSLHIDGFTLYIGLKNGEIYTKSLLFADPTTLLYSSPTGSHILELIKFDGYIYYSDYVGIHRFDPLDAAPITETIAELDTSSDTYPVGLAAKAFESGDKFLYVSKWNQKIIRIDLNDPTLSIKKTLSNKLSRIYPNPALEVVNIKSHSTIQNISVFDLLGKQVLEIALSNQDNNYSLDISNLNSGIYNLQIKSINGIEIKKLVKK